MSDFNDNETGGRDELWQLLGKARKQAVSPLFSRNVLREIRTPANSGRRESGGPFSWLRARWLPASACALGVVLLSLSASRLFVQHKTPVPVAVQNSQAAGDVSKPDDPEVISNLDVLVAYEENSVWLEDSSK